MTENTNTRGRRMGLGGKGYAPRSKRQRLEAVEAEQDIQEVYTVDFCFNLFKISLKERQCTEPTMKAYERMYNKLLRHYDAITDNHGKEAPITMLTKEGAQLAFMDYLKKGCGTDNKEVSPQTINHYLRHYRTFGNFCNEREYIYNFHCPIKEVEAPIKQVYTEAELKKLLVKPPIRNFTEFRNYCIIELILATGARSATIRSIMLKDIDLESGYINFNTTKAHKVIQLGLDRKVRADLAEFIAKWRNYSGIKDTDYLFCNEYGEQLAKDGLIRAISTYNKRRGVEKTSIHLLRHTFAKNWITSGGDIITLARVLTHSDLEMVKRYSNLYATDVRREMEEHSTLSQLRQSSGSTIRSKFKAV